MGYTKGMRTKEEIAEDILATERLIEGLTRELKTADTALVKYNRELAQAHRNEHKLSLYASLGALGQAVEQAPFKQLKRSGKYQAGSYNPHTNCYQLIEDEYTITVSENDHWIEACLRGFSTNTWALRYRVDKYGTSNPRKFTGTKAEAQAWAKQELNKKLVDIKKKLSKNI
jgi:hypothetical protein